MLLVIIYREEFNMAVMLPSVSGDRLLHLQCNTRTRPAGRPEAHLTWTQTTQPLLIQHSTLPQHKGNPFDVLLHHHLSNFHITDLELDAGEETSVCTPTLSDRRSTKADLATSSNTPTPTSRGKDF
ncbi:uncharacterized protein LOC117282630 [Cryptotermes secundus]|uniref:uncharacterized protein LOC117282630 n=1 Tax=Cryptotermes secundus TaxID=105785 RepID=UPI001454D537|nr:uncharacterized protein LOC117282630 [Cryptotermes secundus]